MTKKEHKQQQTVAAAREVSTNALLHVGPADVVIPPLHTLQGLMNTALKAMNNSAPDTLKMLFQLASVTPSHQKNSLLNGRDCQRFLRFILKTANADLISYIHPKTGDLHTLVPVFAAISRVQQFAVAADISNIPLHALQSDVNRLSKAWRKSQLPLINKLHLVESHLVDFIRAHGAWGLFGEQALESLHHLANIAVTKCFGSNANNRLPFFLKRQFLVALCANEFEPKKRKQRTDTTEITDEEEAVLEEIVDYVEEAEWYDEEDLN